MQASYRTKGRENIMRVFMEHCEELISASDMNEFLAEMGTPLNLATIYRNLDKMTDAGILIRYQDEKEDRAVYQYVGDRDECHNHLHMKCIKCGKVMHLECGFMNEIRLHLSDHHEFELQCQNSILYGVCKNCR
ncbi:ferric uptake regulation protein FUR [Lachnospiraceae bacterium KM106-2]|nr:ferric uptake regulation protein FUR [Lachnospiraceae bacterium KM106-2]